jgi:tripartite ATP-independent transporter DctP family solute receptor
MDVYDSASIASDIESLSLIQMGSIVGGAPNTSFLSALDPSFQIMDLPYVTDSQKELLDILENGFGQYLSDNLAKAAQMEIISWVVKGPRVMYENKGPVNKLADLKGMKIRIMENPIMIRSMELMGVIGVPLPGSERVVAMQTGVVDGCEGTIATIWQEKHYEVIKYISFTNHFNTPNTLIMDTRVLGSLPADLQKLIRDSAKEITAEVSAYENSIMDTAMTEMKKTGIKINTIDNLQPFVDATKPVIAESTPKIGKEAIDLFFEIKAQIKK